MRKIKMVGGTLTASWVALFATAAVAGDLQSETLSATKTPLVSLSAIKPGDQVLQSSRLDPSWGQIGPFHGDIEAFSGDIGAFWGQIGPFWGQIGPFWGQIGPFWGQIGPFWGQIGPFWGQIGPFWGQIGPFWGQIGPFSGNETSYAQLTGSLRDFVAKSEAVWGGLVTEKTGQTFYDGFARGVFAKYGIDLDDPSTLEGITEAQRTYLFLDWYDGLMSFTGVDIPDHWMKTANWSPALTQQQGSGKDAVIGLLDFTVKGDRDIKSNIIFYDGVSDFSNGHGAAVASLMVAAHDGRGVMGIAPNAKVAAYNPYDSTETTNWGDVTNGIVALHKAGAHVINMSLGVPGWTLHPEWNEVFADRQIAKAAESTVFVVAAGNDGITQTGTMDWDRKTDPALLVVGSVDPAGNISSFSNRPGDACLGSKKGCSEADMLKDRFLVAPGELLLVSDDDNGFFRRSGTSLAAPLVSGAVALLHDRWPWLTKHPHETADIILKSAKDLGDPGVDETYGWGLLDVTASQSPLDFNKLDWYQSSNGQLTKTNSNRILKSGVQSSWEAKGMYFYAFERIGGTHRDFAIPLSSKLVGQTVGDSKESFQHYIYGRMVDWIGAGAGFSDRRSYAAPVQNMLGWNMTMTAGARNPAIRYREGDTPLQSSLQVATPSGAFAMRLGFGDGAIALGGQNGFGLFSDYDSRNGGVNPMLGFASGGSYANVDMAIAPGLRLSLGTTQQERRHVLEDRAQDEQLLLSALDDYKADATVLSLNYDASDRVSFNFAYTQLDERTGLLGVQSIDRADLRGGSKSDSATFGAEFAFGGGFRLSTSATVARTREGDTTRQSLAVSDGGLVGTAYEVALAKQGVFGGTDRARLSLAQPLFLERGSIDYSYAKVVDRATGEIGTVTERFDITGGKRPFVAEGLYGAPVLDGRGELSLFGRARTRSEAQSADGDLTVGARMRFGF